MIVALFNGEKNISKNDKIFFFLSMLTIPLWMIAKGPLASIILATIINAAAYAPTIRKSWHNPHEENGRMYTLLVVRDVLSIMALENYVVLTLLFPAMRLSLNLTTSAIISVCRRRHKQLPPAP